MILLDIYRPYQISTITDARHDEAYFKNRKNWSVLVIQRTLDLNFAVKYSAKFFEIASELTSNGNLSLARKKKNPSIPGPMKSEISEKIQF